jgi:hypothetical protein
MEKQINPLEKQTNPLLVVLAVFFAIVIGVALVRGITYALMSATGGPPATQGTSTR